MKTSELTGAALDWAVAKCEGVEVKKYQESPSLFLGKGFDKYKPSTEWSQGGPIIEREKIVLGYLNGLSCASMFEDDKHQCMEFGPTPLIAAMRCYCCAKLGDEIDIPQELQPCQQPSN